MKTGTKIKLSDRSWREFKLCDICDIYSGKDISQKAITKGSTPYVSAASINNGIKHFLSNKNETLDKGVISVNRTGSVGYAFYHGYDALYSNNCRKLKLKKSNNKHVSLFIVNQIMQQKDKYSYGYIMGTRRLENLHIMLPINNKNEPDWIFMESHIKNILSSKTDKYKKYVSKYLLTLKHKTGGVYLKTGTKIKLSDRVWKEFKLTDVFDKIQRGKRLTKANQTKGNTPYVSSTGLNNGVDSYISNTDKVRRFSGCLTIANSGSVGSSFYHPYKFVASDHVTHLKKTGMSKYAYLFIATLINRLTEKYNFYREINDARISREKVLLPINENNKPDYEYMEQYIKNLMIEKYNEYLTSPLHLSETLTCNPSQDSLSLKKRG